MKEFTQSWQFFALLSAVFAAMTAIFGKIGVENINSNLATFIRTIVIILVAATFVTAQSASRVAPVDKLSVVFVAVFAMVFLGETGNSKSWLGIGLITAGSIIVSLS